jgi:hypothetical protein
MKNYLLKVEKILVIPKSTFQDNLTQYQGSNGHSATSDVISCKRNADGNTVGRAHDRPILDTRTYDVEFNNGTITELTANKIAECMYAQCDPEGNQYILLDCLVDFDKSLTTISLADQNILVKGCPSKCHNMHGWKICCQWKDGSTTWESLKVLKESHPLEMAEYAITQVIDHEPVFK